MNRPGLKRALALVREGHADGIVVAKLDRFGRTLEVPLVIRGLVDDGKVFLSAADQFDTSTPMGRFALGMMSLVATLERERHIETWGNSTRNAIQRGVAIRVPYGYRRGSDGHLEPAEPAAGVVRKAFALRASGHGINTIADALNTDGIPPTHARQWTRQTVRAMLRVRTYLGEAYYGEHVTVGAHEPLVSAQTWQAAQTPRGHAHARGKSMLTGLVRCAGCGYIMGAGSSRGGRRYNCNRHHGGGRCPSPTSVGAEKLEDHVVAAFLELYCDTEVRAAAANPRLTALEGALTVARHELQTWRDDTELRRTIGDEHYRAGLLARHEAVVGAEHAHGVAVRAVSAETLSIDASAWGDLSIPERRALLALGIDDVLLSRAASTHAPLVERCVIRWAGEGSTDGLPRQGVAGVVR